jgi:hypothetical protein
MSHIGRWTAVTGGGVISAAGGALVGHPVLAAVVGVLLTFMTQLLNPKVMTTIALILAVLRDKDGKQLLELAEIHELGEAGRDRGAAWPRRGRHRRDNADGGAGKSAAGSPGQ